MNFKEFKGEPNLSLSDTKFFVSGFVQTDGYAGYNFLDSRKQTVHVGCWAHARRKFMEAAKLVKRPLTDEPLISGADEAVAFIRKLYAVEKEAKVKNLSAEEWATLRMEKSRPVLDAFKAWLLEKTAITVPKSALGKAISYTLDQWDRLARYMDDVIITPDNNRAETPSAPLSLAEKTGCSQIPPMAQKPAPLSTASSKRPKPTTSSPPHT